MGIMELERIDDWEMRLARQDAWWDREILDRPMVAMEVADACNRGHRQADHHGLLEQRWTDAQWQAERAKERVLGTKWLGDALPQAFPDLGPDFFPALFGGHIRFMETTSYIEPYVDDLQSTATFRFDPTSGYGMIMEQLYDACLEVGKGLFHVGWPDLHPGADCLVGMRGPEQLSLDLLEQPEAVKQSLDSIGVLFGTVYSHYQQKLRAAGQLCTGWPQIVSSSAWHVPSCDFSALISSAMFEEFFLDGLIHEMQSIERNIYHLDGPGALRHLDALLAIKELDAVQWVFGAGNGRASDHIPVYRKIQKAGKGIQILECTADELPVLFDGLDPHGVWLKVQVGSVDEADAVLNAVNRWGRM